MLVDVWVSRDSGYWDIEVWDGEPELLGSIFTGTKIWELSIALAERLGYGVAEGCKRHVVGEVKDAD